LNAARQFSLDIRALTPTAQKPAKSAIPSQPELRSRRGLRAGHYAEQPHGKVSFLFPAFLIQKIERDSLKRLK
jgi:hypothetical protein